MMPCCPDEPLLYPNKPLDEKRKRPLRKRIQLYNISKARCLPSYEQGCYTNIYSPEKSRNITHEWKNTIFFSRVFDIASQLLTRHSPFAPLGQVDEWTAKPSRFSIQGNLSELSRIMPARNIKKAVPRKDNDVQTFLEGEKNKYTKRTESYVFSDFGNGVSRGWERKLTTGRFAIGRFCPFTWNTSSVGKDRANKWEVCKLIITPIVVFVIMIQRIFPSWALAPPHCTIVDSSIHFPSLVM